MKNKNALTGVVAAIAVLAAGYVAATAYTGHRIAQAYEGRLDDLQHRMPFLHLQRQAQRGLFSSTYTTEVSIGCKAQPMVVGIRDHVRHGPLPGFDGFGAAVIDSEIVLPEQAPAALRDYAGSLKPGDIRTRVGYGGDFRTEAKLPAGRFDGTGITVTWPAFRIEGDGSLDSFASRFEASLPELTVQHSDDKDTSSLKLVGLKMRGESSGGGGGLWMQTGTGALEIGQVDLESQAVGREVALKLSKVKYASETRLDQELLGGKVGLTADATLQPGRDAQPIKIDDIELRESFQRLHAPTLQKFVEEDMAQLSDCDSTAADGGKADPAQLLARSQERMQALLMQLLPHDPEVSVDTLAMRLGGDRGQLSYSVGIHGFRPQDGETFMAALPRLMKAVTLKADTSFPAAWVRQLGTLGGDADGAERRVAQADTLLDVGVGKGFIVRDGDELSSHFVFENGAGTLNGKPLGMRP